MREILFRGKRIDNGEWVCGNYAFTDIDSRQYFIFQNKAFEHEVIPETVGQYTGLTDKNGNKIFEGDIVDIGFELDDPYIWRSTIYYERAVVTWNKEHFGWYALFIESKDELSLWEYDDSDIITVIGNIHDNPEHLKGGEVVERT